jgi:hypothetical protein
MSPAAPRREPGPSVPRSAGLTTLGSRAGRRTHGSRAIPGSTRWPVPHRESHVCLAVARNRRWHGREVYCDLHVLRANQPRKQTLEGDAPVCLERSRTRTAKPNRTRCPGGGRCRAIRTASWNQGDSGGRVARCQRRGGSRGAPLRSLSSTRTAPDRVTGGLRSASRGCLRLASEGLGRGRDDLVISHIANPLCDIPPMAKRINELAVPLAPELVFQWMTLVRTRAESASSE